MKSLAWIVGLSGVMVFSAWACGDEVEQTPTTASSTSVTTSGNGGSTTTSSTTQAASSTSSSMMDCDMEPDICAQACCHVEVDCGIPNGCALAMQLLGIDLSDCSNETSDCIAQCVAPADCGAIGSLATQNPDPALQACVAACAPPGCEQCVATNCLSQLMACQQVTECAAFLMCVQTQMCQDEACFLACAQANPSQETNDVLTCAQTNCGGECLGAGGAGGN